MNFYKSSKRAKFYSTFLTILGVSSVMMAQSALSDGVVNYNTADGMLTLPRVHVGVDQYEVTMKKQPGDDFKFVMTDAKLVSMLTFKDSQNPEFSKAVLLSELIAQFPSQEIKVFDPTENREKTFRAVSTNSVLDSIYGPEWRTREEVVTAALDGYESVISVDRFIKYNSFIAYEDTKRPQFVLVKGSDGKLVELGPFWLIWDNINQPDLKAWVSYGWPWQMNSINFVKTAERFANSVPPVGSAENIRRGFESTREFCMACHKINGDGGTRGPELIKTGEIAKETKEDLKLMITDIKFTPSKASGMVLRDEIPNRDQVADDIVDYLFAMAGR